MSMCPECNAGVGFAGNPTISEVVECAGCHSELEVISIGPLRLAVAPAVEEDWGE